MPDWPRLLALACALAAPGAARAQAARADEIVTPAQREQQLQENNGARLGAFVIQPSLDLDVSYDDNIYATDTDRRDDLIAEIRPMIEVRSLLTNKTIRGQAFFSRRRHAENTSEDASQYGGLALAQFTLTRQLGFSAAVNARSVVERRGNLDSDREASRPVRYGDLEGQLGLSFDTGRIFANLGLRGRRLVYGDAQVGDVTEDQSFRDSTNVRGSLGVGYRLYKLTRVVANFEIERRRYDLRPGDVGFDPVANFDRSANGFRVEAGLQRELSALVSGTVRVGYLKFNYSDPRLLDVSAFSYFGDLRWSATPLTTFSLSASRRLDETVSPQSSGNLRDEVTLRAEHELLRTLYLSGSVRRAWIRPTGEAAKSRELSVDVAARYYFGRRFRLELSYNRRSRSSRDADIAFKNNVVLVGISVLP